MESVKCFSFTYRLTALPFTSLLKLASLWHARQSAVVNFGDAGFGGGAATATAVNSSRRPGTASFSFQAPDHRWRCAAASLSAVSFMGNRTSSPPAGNVLLFPDEARGAVRLLTPARDSSSHDALVRRDTRHEGL